MRRLVEWLSYRAELARSGDLGTMGSVRIVSSSYLQTAERNAFEIGRDSVRRDQTA